MRLEIIPSREPLSLHPLCDGGGGGSAGGYYSCGNGKGGFGKGGGDDGPSPIGTKFNFLSYFLYL